MPLDPEDPRLTAYALGELDDDEKRDFEAELAGSPDAGLAVEDVRATARLLALSLGEEPRPVLAPEHHRAIEGGMAAPAPATAPVHFTPRSWTGYGLAASILLGFGLSAAWLATGGFGPRETDRNLLARTATKSLPPTVIERGTLESPPSGRDSAIRSEDSSFPDRSFADIVTEVEEGPAPAPEPGAVPGLAKSDNAYGYVAHGGAAGPARSSESAAIPGALGSNPSPTPGGPPIGGARQGMGGGGMLSGGRTGESSAFFSELVKPSAPPTGLSATLAPDPGDRSRGRAAKDSLSERGASPADASLPGLQERGLGLAKANSGVAALKREAKFGEAMRSPGVPRTQVQGDVDQQENKIHEVIQQGQMQGGINQGAAQQGQMQGADQQGQKQGAAQQQGQQQGADQQGQKRGDAQQQGQQQGADQQGQKRGAAQQQGQQQGADQQGQKRGDAQPGQTGGPTQAGQNPANPEMRNKEEWVEKMKRKAFVSDSQTLFDKIAPKADAPKVTSFNGSPSNVRPDVARDMADRPALEKKLGRLSEDLPEAEGFAGKPAIPEARLDVVPAPPPAEAPGNEEFAPIVDNPFTSVAIEPLSTFSIDVDTASYSNVRRFLMAEGRMPPPDAVRIEEMVNYFPYDYDAPRADDPNAPPFSVNVEIAEAPWNRDHRLARIALKGKVETRARVSNLVFLIDVSGSMDQPNKLPLVQASLRMLAEQLGENDRVSIVVYAGAAGLVLDSVGGYDKPRIAEAIDRLKAGGSTAGGEGIELAYNVAQKNFINGGVNRVILATDGDFNVGINEDSALQAFIAEKARSKVDLSVLAYGTGNLKDSKMEGLADKGNGNYAYIDSLLEARKVLVEQIGGTLVTIAKDVKIQVDFNPTKVGAYRLIGYENRVMAAQDFANDAKDAGEIGAGHTVTAFYELVPPTENLAAKVEDSKYTKVVAADPANAEVFTVNLRYKPPGGDVSSLLAHPVTDAGKAFPAASDDFKFASSVAAFGMILRNSPYKGTATLAGVLEIAQSAHGKDLGGYRKEFGDLVRKAEAIAPAPGR